MMSALLSSCSSSSGLVNDDAYYSPYDDHAAMDGTLVTSDDGRFGSSAIRDNKDYDYSEYYKEEPGADTIYIVEESTPEAVFTIGFDMGFGWPYYSWGYWPYYGPYYMPSWYFGWGYDPWYGTYWHGGFWSPWGPWHPWHPYCCHHTHYAGIYNHTWDRPHSNHNKGYGGGINGGRSGNTGGGLQVAGNARAGRPTSSAVANGPRTSSSRPASSTRPASVRTGSRPTADVRTGSRPTQATRPSQATRRSVSASLEQSYERSKRDAANATRVANGKDSRQSRSNSEYVRPQNSTVSRTTVHNTRDNSSSGRDVRTTTTTRSSSSTRSLGNATGGSVRSGGGSFGGARSGGGGGSVRSGGGRR